MTPPPVVFTLEVLIIDPLASCSNPPPVFGRPQMSRHCMISSRYASMVNGAILLEKAASLRCIHLKESQKELRGACEPANLPAFV